MACGCQGGSTAGTYEPVKADGSVLPATADKAAAHAAAGPGGYVREKKAA